MVCSYQIQPQIKNCNIFVILCPMRSKYNEWKNVFLHLATLLHAMTVLPLFIQILTGFATFYFGDCAWL